MTREQAKSKIRMSVTVNKDNIKSLEKADEIIDQIFDDHEAQLKAKDEEIYWSKVLTLKELCKEIEIDDLLKSLSIRQIEEISNYFKMIEDKQ